jgi:hypothetical protein
MPTWQHCHRNASWKHQIREDPASASERERDSPERIPRCHSDLRLGKASPSVQGDADLAALPPERELQALIRGTLASAGRGQPISAEQRGAGRE